MNINKQVLVILTSKIQDMGSFKKNSFIENLQSIGKSALRSIFPLLIVLFLTFKLSAEKKTIAFSNKSIAIGNDFFTGTHLEKVDSKKLVSDFFLNDGKVHNRAFKPMPLSTVDLSVASNTTSEANPTDIIVTVTSSAAVTSNETVTLTVISGNSVDFLLNNAPEYIVTVTIPAGMTTGNAIFKAVDDTNIEGEETFTLEISNPSAGITIGSIDRQSIIIYDNEGCGVLASTVILSSQSQVDEFLTVTHPGCTAFMGNLIIQDDNNGTDNITTLAPLSDLSYIKGDLKISGNNALQNLNGLSSLDSIGNDFIITLNSMLVNIDSLSGLTKVGNKLEVSTNALLTNINGLSSLSKVNKVDISSNPSLTNIDGFSSLTSISQLAISSNNALTNLSGLQSLTSAVFLAISNNPALDNIGGMSNLNLVYLLMRIQNNDNLQNINGLSSLSRVGYMIIDKNDNLLNIDGLSTLDTLAGINITQNNALTNINGLSNLSSLDAIEIIDNPALTNLDGLSNLTVVKGVNGISLTISGNNALTNVNGLSNLDSLGGSLELKDNALLSQCCGLYPIINAEVNNGGTAIAGSINISGNLMGCNSTAEILSECNKPIVANHQSISACYGSSPIVLKATQTTSAGMTTITIPAIWSPTTSLYTDAAAMIPYTGGAVDSLWLKPTILSNYIVSNAAAGTTAKDTVAVAIYGGFTSIHDTIFCSSNLSSNININGGAPGGTFSWTSTNNGTGVIAGGNSSIIPMVPNNISNTIKKDTVIVTAISTPPIVYTINNGTYAFADTTGSTYLNFGSGSEYTFATYSNFKPIGFDFKYFGNTYNQVRLGIGGDIKFTGSTTRFNTDVVFEGQYRAWLNTAGTSKICYKTTGTAPNRKMIITFINFGHPTTTNDMLAGCTDLMGNPFPCGFMWTYTADPVNGLGIFQIILNETTNVIESAKQNTPSLTRVSNYSAVPPYSCPGVICPGFPVDGPVSPNYEGAVNGTASKFRVPSRDGSIWLKLNNETKIFTPNAPMSCAGKKDTFVVTVLPLPKVDSITDKVTCPLGAIPPINFSSPITGTTVNYKWTNNNTSIGLAAKGNGNIPSFTASATAGTATIIVNPYIVKSLGDTCFGTARFFMINSVAPIHSSKKDTLCYNTAKVLKLTSNPGQKLFESFETATGGGFTLGSAINYTIGSFVVSSSNASSIDVSVNSLASEGTKALKLDNFALFSNLNLAITGPTLNLANSTPTVTLKFDHILKTTSTVLKVYPQYSTDNGITWTTIPTSSYSGTAASYAGYFTGSSYTTWASSPITSSFYKTETFTLPAGALTSQFKMRLNVLAPANTPGYLYYLDNIRIEAVGAASTFPASWSPTTNLYTNEAATTAYTGAVVDSVWAKPIVNTNYIASRQVSSGCFNTDTIKLVVKGTFNAVQDTTFCSSGEPSINIYGSVGNTYNWTSTQHGTGIAASGTSNPISFVIANNTTNAVKKDTVIVTTMNGSCVGQKDTFMISILPAAKVDSITNKQVCLGGTVDAINFTSPINGSIVGYKWTNNNTAIGLAASGNGNIASFTASNTGGTATITVRPYIVKMAGDTCFGNNRTFMINVGNPSAPVAASCVIYTGTKTLSQLAIMPLQGGILNYYITPLGGVALPGSTLAKDDSTYYISQSLNGCEGTRVQVKVNRIANDTLVLCSPATVTNLTAATLSGNSVNWYNVPMGGTPLDSNAVLQSGMDTLYVEESDTTTSTLFNYNVAGNLSFLIALTLDEHDSIYYDTYFEGEKIYRAKPDGTNSTLMYQGSTATTASINSIVYEKENSNRYLYFATTRTLGRLDINTLTRTLIDSSSNYFPMGQISRDAANNKLYFGSNRKVYVKNLTSGLVTVLDSVPSAFSLGAAYYSPTSNSLYFGDYQRGKVYRKNLATGVRTDSISVIKPKYIFEMPDGKIGVACENSIIITNPNLTNPITLATNVSPSSFDAAQSDSKGNIIYIEPFAMKKITLKKSNRVPISVIVNPIANVIPTTDTTVCNGSTIPAINFVTTTTSDTITYTWTNNNPDIGLAASGSGNIASFVATNPSNVVATTATIIVTPTIINAGISCEGVKDTFLITVNPTIGVRVIPNQIVCNGSLTTAVTFSGPRRGDGENNDNGEASEIASQAVLAIVYNWTNNTPSIGLAASGSGSIPSFTAVNSGNAPITATIVITPSFINNGVTCMGTPRTFTITVNPTVTLDTVANQIICNSTNTTAINFSSSTTGGAIVYNWINDNGNIGLDTIGTGDIASFVATNSGIAPDTASITVTPTYTNAGVTCIGKPRTFTITVNPTPIITAIADKVVCNGASVNAVTPTSTATGGTTTYTWTNNNTSIGLTASGTSTLPTFTATNSGTAPVTASIIVTPTFANGGINCVGTPDTFLVIVNPTPKINAIVDQTVTKGSIVDAIVPTTTATGGTVTYTWTNNTTSIGLAASGTTTIPSFTAANSGTTPITATILVTPTFANGGSNCSGIKDTFLITVNPMVMITNSPEDTTTYSNGGSYPGYTPSTSASGGTVTYAWTNNTPAIGLPASGNGPVPSFTPTNTGTAPLTACIIVTPTFTLNGVSSTGVPDTFYITANPTAMISPALPNVTVSPNTPTSAIIPTTSASGGTTTYAWTNSNTGLGLAASGSGFIPPFTPVNTDTAPSTAMIIVTPTFSNGGINSVGMPDTFIITVNPIAQITNPPANLTIASSGTFIPPYIPTTSATGGTVTYAWTNSNTAIGLGSGGMGPIPAFTTINTGTAPLKANIIVIPTFTLNGVSTPGTPDTFMVVVNPIAMVNAISDTVVCKGTSLDTIVFNTTATGGTTTYTWTNSNTAIGLAASGTGNITAFSATNTSTTPLMSRIIVTPSFVNSNGGSPSIGIPDTFNIMVNPMVMINAIADNVICNGVSVSSVIPSTTATGGSITYTWTNNNTSIGLAASGIAMIPAFTATNVGTAPATATIIVTPTFANGGISCVGTPDTFNITVNPATTVASISNVVECNGSVSPVVTILSPITGGSIVYNWTNSNPSIGLAASGVGNIPSYTASNTTNAPKISTVTITPTFTNAGVSCIGTPTSYTITINPPPKFDSIFPQFACNGATTPAITFSTPLTGGTAVFNWTNSNTAIGLAASGAGNLTRFTAVNSGSAPLSGNVSVTMSYTNAGLTCISLPKVFAYTVNPTVVVNPIANQVLCNATSSTPINFSTTATGGIVTYAWANNTPAIGLAASGTGNIPLFTASNNTRVPLIATVTVTPTFSNGGLSCVGTLRTFTITVNPVAKINAINDQVLCNNTSTSEVSISTTATGGITDFNWVNNNTSVGLGASGTGDIAAYTALNSTMTAQVARVIITPTFSNAGLSCVGILDTFTYTVAPVPMLSDPADQTVCANTINPATNFVGGPAGAFYTWTNSNTAIGLPASGTGNITAFTALNPTSSTITSTITVTPKFSVAGLTCNGTPPEYVITVFPGLSITMNDENQCEPQPLSLSVIVTGIGQPPYTYNWQGPNGFISTIANPTIVPTSWNVNTGTYSVLVTDVNGCTGTGSKFITINPTPVMTQDVENLFLCPGEIGTLSCKATISGGVPITYYLEQLQPSGWAVISSNAIGSFSLGQASENMDKNQYRIKIVADHSVLPDCDLYTSVAMMRVQTNTAVACNNKMNISIGHDCNTEITAQTILSGLYVNEFYSIQLTYNNVVISNPITSQYLGKTITATITERCSGNSCKSLLNMEDKLPPVVVCEDSTYTFKCKDLASAKAGLIALGEPVIEDCSEVIKSYKDEVLGGECNNTIVRRTWSIKDKWGNAAPNCIQEVIFETMKLSDVILPPAYVEMNSCGIGIDPENIAAYFDVDSRTGQGIGAYNDDWAESTGSPEGVVELNEGYQYAYPHYFTTGHDGKLHAQKIDKTICNIVATYEDQVLDACAVGCTGNSKVIRTWTLLDWCTGGISKHVQIINAVDHKAPTFIVKDITVSVNPWGCIANFDAPMPWELSDNCDAAPKWWIEGPAGAAITGNSKDGYKVSGLPKGVHDFIYKAVDCCGNVGSVNAKVTVIDRSAPVAVAKQNLVLSLTSSGTSSSGAGILYATAVNNGSYDHCTDIKLEIRRADGAPNCDNLGINGHNNNVTYNNDEDFTPGTSWTHPEDDKDDTDNGSYVKFCCDDLSGTNSKVHQVIMRVWDDGNMNGIVGDNLIIDGMLDNYNETWADIRVENKLLPTIICPPDATVTCDMDLGIATDWNDVINVNLTTGEAEGFDLCTGIKVEYKDTPTWTNTCQNVGRIRREFRTVKGTNNVNCFQTITVDALPSSFVITPPSNSIIDAPCDFNKSDIKASDKPKIQNGPCDVIGEEITIDTFYFEDGVCKKWRVTYNYINWCTGEQKGPYVKYYKYKDEVKLVLTCQDQMFASNPNPQNPLGGCEGTVTLEASATDEGGCIAGGWLKWTVLVDLWGNGTSDYEFSSFLPTTDNNLGNDTNGNGIPDRYVAPTSDGQTVKVPAFVIDAEMSTHKVLWQITDGCGNVTSCNSTFMVVDKKAPTPYCVSLSTAVMDNGQAELWAVDFNKGSFDNCTPQNALLYTFDGAHPVLTKLNIPHYFKGTGIDATVSEYNAGSAQRWSPEHRSSAKVFNCDDVHSSPVHVKMNVWDSKYNTDYCEINLTVIDNQNACNGSSVSIGGDIQTEKGEGIKNVDVELSSIIPGYPRNQMSDYFGDYLFDNLPMNGDYNVKGVKRDDWMNGISTLDLVLIQRHILGISKLDSPYKIIAADINNDGKVTATDLVILRKLILGVIDVFPNNNSWRFLDESTPIINPNSPWPLDELINIKGVNQDRMKENFIGLKVGDVNGSASAAANTVVDTRRNQGLVLKIEDQDVKAKDVIDLPVKAHNFSEIYGFQFAANLFGLEVMGISEGAIKVDGSNLGIPRTGIMTMSWANEKAVNINDGEVLFTLHLKANNSGSLKKMIALSTGIISSESYAGGTMTTGKLALDIDARATTFVLYQNEPNPFKSTTEIKLFAPKSSKMRLTISDITGKRLTVRDIDVVEGMNKIQLSRNEIRGTGFLFYTLSNEEFTATKSLIMVE